MPEAEVALLLGADLGDPRAQLDKAESAIGSDVGAVVSRSRDHWTKPWGFDSGTLFLNRALMIRTKLDPQELLIMCLRIERLLGRERASGAIRTSRMIDIDIVAIGELVVDTPQLIVPHPRLHLRRFALAPLSDVAPSWQHPTLGRTALELLDALPRT